MPDAETTETPDRAARAVAEQAARAGRKINKSDLNLESKIKILSDGNPRREGTVPHEHFEKYQNGMTVKTLFERDGEWLHLQADIERGYIELTK